MSAEDLTKKLQALINRYIEKIQEKDREIQRLQEDNEVLAMLATEKGVIKPLPESLKAYQGVV